ncbi:MAG TPA: RiPP maturation radical SAM C-methyltransferase [Vicinamibacterales bacterium]
MDVLLVSMPFGSAFAPSLGLSLLKAGLTNRGMTSRVRYFSIRFAELTGQAFYEGIAGDGRPRTRELAGEWIFSHALFNWSAEDDQRYLDRILLKSDAFTLSTFVKPISPALARRVAAAREQVGPFLNWCIDEVLRDQPRIVGFTSVFQQHLASLALARRIKEVSPETVTVFGGANCEGVMGAETVRQFPFVDAVVSGEADEVFPELVQRVLDGIPFADLQGVRTPQRVHAEFEQGRFSTPRPIQNMDVLPYPDFDDYFAQFEASKYGRVWQPNLFVETSRGCWWGEKMHCTFCGLNGATMAYRSKTPERALDELVALAGRHPGCDLQVVDNILDMGYFKTLLPALAARQLDLGLFFETKSNLKKDHIRLLRLAGIRYIQPGIESLSDEVLSLMRKGVSSLQNIQLLKWCKELGVRPAWNLLFGFPGESSDAYARMAKLVPYLTHLPPPGAISIIRLDRFSPNFFDAEKLGLIDIEPVASYQHVYQLPRETVANLAYYFTFRYREPRDVSAYVRSLHEETVAWMRSAAESDLFAVDVGSQLLIWDLRPASRQPLIVMDGLDRVLYQTCDAACDVRRLVTVAQTAGFASTIDEVAARLEPLVERGLLLRDGTRYLALAIPLGEYVPSAPVVDRFFRVVSLLGQPTPTGTVVSLKDAGRTERSSFSLAARRGSRQVRQKGTRRVHRSGLTPAQFEIAANGDLLIGARH